MAIHFHAGDNSAVAELVRSSVDASLSIHTQSLVEIGKLIMHKVVNVMTFEELCICMHVAY